MQTSRTRVHKHFQLDSIKIKRAQKALDAKTETEAIERALDLAIAEHENNGHYPRDPLYGDGQAGKRIAQLLAQANLKIEKRLTY